MQNNNDDIYKYNFVTRNGYVYNKEALEKAMQKLSKINDSSTVIITDEEKKNFVMMKNGDVVNNISMEIVYDKDKIPLEDDIAAIKKRIKHSKSPLEKIQLSKMLNNAYKKRKLSNKAEVKNSI